MNVKEIRRENLRLLGEKYEKQAEFARASAIASPYMNQLISGHRDMGDKMARKLEHQLGLPENWMDHPHADAEALTPATDEIRFSRRTSNASYAGVPEFVEDGGEAGSEMPDGSFYAPFYEAEAAAGLGRINSDSIQPDTTKIVPADIRRKYNLSTQHTIIITARGSSMAPYINSGDLLYIDTRKTDPVDEKVYVINVDGQLKVKQIQRQDAHTLRLVSLNERWPDETVRLDQEHVAVIGEVVARSG